MSFLTVEDAGPYKSSLNILMRTCHLPSFLFISVYNCNMKKYFVNLCKSVDKTIGKWYILNINKISIEKEIKR